MSLAATFESEMERRVVITGMGVVSPIGNDLETFWDSLVSGRIGISRIDDSELLDYECKIAGKIRVFDAYLFLC